MEIVYNHRTGGCKTVTDTRLIGALEELERAAAAIV